MTLGNRLTARAESATDSEATLKELDKLRAENERLRAQISEAWQKGFETANDTLRKLFEKELEKKRSKAFEAAWTRGWEWDGLTLDAAYRAYREKEGA